MQIIPTMKRQCGNMNFYRVDKVGARMNTTHRKQASNMNFPEPLIIGNGRFLWRF